MDYRRGLSKGTKSHPVLIEIQWHNSNQRIRTLHPQVLQCQELLSFKTVF